MPNKNYIKGRKKEYKIVKEYRDKGFDIVQRTAGSHSPFDVIAIHTKEKKILLVQSKSSVPQSARDKLVIDNRLLNGKFKVSFEVWV